MTAFPVLLAHRRAARLRVALDTAALGLPLLVAAALVAGRLLGVGAGLAVGVVGLCAIAFLAVRRALRLDGGWLIDRLDAHLPGFEDSSALLMSGTPPRDGLARLQRERLEARIAQAQRIDLRPAWSTRRIALAWTVGAALALVAVAWPSGDAGPTRGAGAGIEAIPSGPPALTRARLRITPPAYTGLPPREQSALDARVPEGSRIDWILGFEPRVASATLAFPDAQPMPLARDGARWTGGRRIDRSMLYRIEAPGLARQRLHRIDSIADAEPVVRLVAPDSQLVMVTPGQRRWSPVFEVSDDHGVSEVATLRVTVTQGDGENVTFLQRSAPLRGSGQGRTRRFSVTLDLAREGLASGGDMIVQLVVADNRAPERQVVEGPSVILRWPSDLALADGLDGMMQPVMPAYFRSQRQIIIDAEALIAQRTTVAPDRYLDRSNALGADQAQLRLRYGQFMGEEAEGGGGLALPTNDAPGRPALPTNDDPAAGPIPAPEAHNADDGHDHDGEILEPGVAVDPLRDFGHAHDTGDADTLFDPGTRSTLADALDAMWSSERALRQGRPDEALPFAYRALEFLKTAQQASRIFLPRVGSQLPPIDLSRRLAGEREDIVADAPPPAPRPAADAVAGEAWRALEERPVAGRSPPLRLGALERWARDNRGRLADPLALSAAIDTVRNEPACLECRRRLRAQLWTALERPPAGVRRREAADARGRRYLDALR